MNVIVWILVGFVMGALVTLVRLDARWRKAPANLDAEELLALQIIWEHGGAQGLRARDVVEMSSHRIHWAVYAVLGRLVEKGLLVWSQSTPALWNSFDGLTRWSLTTEGLQLLALNNRLKARQA